MRYDILKTKDYHMSMEVDVNYNALIHLDVFVWTPRVARGLRQTAKDTAEALLLEGFNRVYSVMEDARFAVRFCGGVVDGTIVFEGKEYEVIIWDFH